MLDADEVEKRTEVTIKLAQAAGESATSVSSYMTAIWNNFSDGADNLERYADVITKLGAATAASSAEIAGGLEKFAAVANTVGLSYDYAAAAVTTIVDKTRQSEDVVGTSLKTIFARLESLQLGETLDDDTTLNKYSSALLSVGVNIKDTNGDLKQMDQILDELGPRWAQLAQDQKIALAQTVGGMRQYNQFIALMDNFESFQENISLAQGAEGTLQEQANIYAESWEAAKKRVTAAAQAIYQDLLDDKQFIKILNILTDILQITEKFIENMGGLKGILGQIAPILMQLYSTQINNVVRTGVNAVQASVSTITNGKVFGPTPEQQKQAQVNSFLGSAKAQLGEDSVGYQLIEDEQRYQLLLANRDSLLTETQKEELKMLHEIQQARIKHIEDLKEEIKLLKERNKEIQNVTIEQGKRLGYSEEITKNLQRKATSANVVESVTSGVGPTENMSIPDRMEFLFNADNTQQLTDAQELYSNTTRYVEDEDRYEEFQQDYFTQMQTEYNNILANVKDEVEQQRQIVELYTRIKDYMNGFTDSYTQNLNGTLSTMATAEREKNFVGTNNHNDQAKQVVIDSFRGQKSSIQNGVLYDTRGLEKSGATIENMLSNVQAARDKYWSKVTSENKILSAVDGKGLASSAQNIDDYSKKVKQAQQDLQKYDEAIKRLTEILNEEADEQEKRNSPENDEYIENVIDAGLSQGEQETKEQTANSVKESGKKVYDKSGQILSPDSIAMMQSFATAAMQVSSALYSIQSAFSVINDESASFGQKVGAIFQALISSTMQLTMLLNNQNLALSLNTLAEKLNAAAKRKNAQETDALTQSTERNIAADGADTVSTTLNTGVETAGSAATGGAGLATGGVGAAAKTSVIGGLKSIVGAIGPALGTVLAVAAIAAITYAVTKKINDAIQQKAIDAAKDNLEEIQNNLEELGEKQTALDSFRDIRNEFDKGVASMQDYKNSLLETAEALGIVHADVILTYQGIAALNSEIESAQSEVAESYAQQLSQATANQQEIFRRLDYEQWNWFGESGDNYQIGAGADGNNGDEKEIQDYIRSLNSNLLTIDGSGDLNINWGEINSAADYQQLLEAFAEIESNSGTYASNEHGKSELYKGIMELKEELEIDSWVTALEENTEALTYGASASATAALVNARANTEGAFDYDNYKTMFNDIVNELVGQGITQSIAETTAQQVLESTYDTEETPLASMYSYLDDYLENTLQLNTEPTMTPSSTTGPSELEQFQEALSDFDNQDEIIASIAKYPDAFQLIYRTSDNAVEALAEFNSQVENLPEPLAEANSLLEAIGTSSLPEAIKSLNEAMDKISNGAIFEDISLFGDYAEDYFTLMADGTYKLTGDAEDFYKLVHSEIGEDAIREQINVYRNALSLEGSEAVDTGDENSAINQLSNLIIASEEANEARDTLQTFQDLKDESSLEGGYSFEALTQEFREFLSSDIFGEYLAQAAQDNRNVSSQDIRVEFANAKGYDLNAINAIYADSMLDDENGMSTMLQAISGTNDNGVYDDMLYYNSPLVNGLYAQDLQQDYINTLSEMAQGLDTEATKEQQRFVYDSLLAPLMGLTDGYDEVKFQSVLEQFQNTYSDAWEKIQAGDWEGLAEDLETFQGALATSQTSVDDLVEELGDLEISEDVYKDKLNAVIQTEAEAHDIDLDELDEYQDYLLANVDALEGNEEAANDLALATLRLRDGIGSLSSGFEDWSEILSDDSLVNTQQYSEAWNDLRDSMADVFAVDSEDIDMNFILDNLDLIGRMAEGDSEAFQELSRQITISNIQSILANEQLSASSRLAYEEILAWIQTIDGSEMRTALSIEDVTNYENLSPLAKKLLTSEDNDISNFYNFSDLGNFKSWDISSYVKDSSSGSSSSRSTKDQKDLEDEFERYYTITRQLKDLEDQYNRVDKAKERAFGKAKLTLIKEESSLLEQEIAGQKEYLSQIKDYYLSDQANLNAFGAQYDDNGVVTNYEEMIRAQVAAYNDAVNQYNAGSIDEAAFDIAEQKYEDFTEKLKQYDETNQLWQSEQDALTDLQNQLYDLNLEYAQTELDITIEVNDDSLKLLEYRLDRINEKAFSTAEALAESFKSIDIQLSNQDANQTFIDSILGDHGLTMDSISGLSEEQIAGLGFTESEIEGLRSGIDGLLEAQKAIDEIQNDIIDGPLTVMNEWNEEFDRLNSNIEHSKKVMQSLKDITDLTRSNTGVSSEFILGLQQQQYGASLEEVRALYAENEANQTALAKAKSDYEAAVASGADENVLSRLKSNLNEIESTAHNTEESLLSSLEDTLKEAQELLESSVDVAKEKIQELTQTTDFDDTVFDLMTQIDDKYLDDYEKIYEFSKLTRDINKSLENESSADNISRYKEVLAEIQELEESGKEVTEYDVEALRKKYELAQAYANLQDSQNAKSTVRMSRDADGNYSYVYSAGNNDDALQNYEDKLYEYQKLNSEYIKEQQKEFRELVKTAQNAYEQIAKSTTLTPEEKEEQIATLKEYYETLGVTITTETDLALTKNRELYDGYWTWYSEKYDYAKSKLGDYQTQFEYTQLGVLNPTFNSAQEMYNSYYNAINGEDGYIPKLTQAWEDYASNQADALEAAGTSLEEFAAGVVGAMTTAGAAASSTADETETAASRMTTAFDQVRALFEQMNGLGLDGMRSEIESSIDSLNSLISTYARVSEAAEQNLQKLKETASQAAQYAAKIASAAGSSSGDGTVTSPSTNSKSSITTRSANSSSNQARIALSSDFYRWLSNDPNAPSNASMVLNATKLLEEGITRGGMGEISVQALQSVLSGYQHGMGQTDFLKWFESNRTEILKWINKQGMMSFRNKGVFEGFDTGGYTGAWNDSSGRLAILHQKELVLNAEDTENMLSMVQIARDTLNTIDGSSIAANVINGIATNVTSGFSGNSEFEQNVHIEATFTDATTRDEITAAFDTLINRASQYAGRKTV